eukprot:scaffold138500_cov39-Prasinocladus_malaysianus.AAC.1
MMRVRHGSALEFVSSRIGYTNTLHEPSIDILIELFYYEECFFFRAHQNSPIIGMPTVSYCGDDDTLRFFSRESTAHTPRPGRTPTPTWPAWTASGGSPPLPPANLTSTPPKRVQAVPIPTVATVTRYVTYNPSDQANLFWAFPMGVLVAGVLMYFLTSYAKRWQRVKLIARMMEPEFGFNLVDVDGRLTSTSHKTDAERRTLARSAKTTDQ